MPDFYEFFAGGGMVRAGLGPHWRCVFANDFDHKKSRTYRENWGDDGELITRCVSKLDMSDIPDSAALAWASFPCQDLSLAGGGAGLRGERSGTFKPFWKVIEGLIREGRAPRLIVLENVCGTLNSHGGNDFVTICDAFHQVGYTVGAVVIDAALFVPQSRPRLFLIGVHPDLKIPARLTSEVPVQPWHTKGLKTAYEKLAPRAKGNWIWWRFPVPPQRTQTFADLIEEEPQGVSWFTAEKMRHLLSLMSEVNRAKVNKAKKLQCRTVGTIYRRTRPNEAGTKVQRAEVRFDDVSGCLRTPAGGSSRQVILVVHGQSVRARLISTRETARLMGLHDGYILPQNYNEAYHLTGDGVVVPVVRHLAAHIFEPILNANPHPLTVAA